MRTGYAFTILGCFVASHSLGCHEAGAPPIDVTVTEAAAVAAPPVISGGTLLVTADGQRAVAADSDRDRVVIVDLAHLAIERTVILEQGDEPGRIVEGANGVVHVALRRSGAVASIDLGGGMLERRLACPAPRGLAHDAARGELHVACAGGELVTFADGAAEPRRVLRLDRDLRDVVVDGAGLLVTRFRSAEILRIDAVGAVVSRARPNTVTMPPSFFALSPDPLPFVPGVAWRMQQHPKGGAVVVHQLGLDAALPTGPSPVGVSYYAADCGSTIVQAGATVLHDGSGSDAIDTLKLGAHPLTTDFAFGPGERVAFAVAGGGYVIDGRLQDADDSNAFSPGGCGAPGTIHVVPGEPHSVAFAGDTLLAQTRQPATLWLRKDGKEFTVSLADDSRRSVGHALFHRAAGPFAPIACASCHPEGGEDGRAWKFETLGARRTQPLAGGMSATAPFHWDGDLADMHDIMSEVFVNRMGGVLPSESRIDELTAWLDTVPGLPVTRGTDEAAIARGDALFHDATLACGSCHSGERLTNNATVDVGTGKAFQVPSLVGVAHRTPLMHDGCAPALSARFSDPACGGGDSHGKTSHLSKADLADLTAYLETL